MTMFVAPESRELKLADLISCLRSIAENAHVCLYCCEDRWSEANTALGKVELRVAYARHLLDELRKSNEQQREAEAHADPIF